MQPDSVSTNKITDEVTAALSGLSADEVALIDPLIVDVNMLDSTNAAALIDHTLLKPDTTESAVRKLCAEAIEYGFASVCVNSAWLSLCRKLLVDTPIKCCVVVGFPLGATTSLSKAFETTDAIKHGADEVDMVINIGWLKDKAYSMVYEDIAGVVKVAHADNVLVKVILETFLLDKNEKIAGCLIAKAAGADFVKTSTGFNGGGATVEDVALMRQTVGPRLGVKASGGVRTADDARQMVSAGATRIGASAGVVIVQSFSENAASEAHQESDQRGDIY